MSDQFSARGSGLYRREPCSACDRKDAEITQLRTKLDVACETIRQMQDEREQRRSYQVLASLSSWLSQGSGDGSVSATEYEARIREGVDHIVRVETSRREAAEAECARLRKERDVYKARSEQDLADWDVAVVKLEAAEARATAAEQELAAAIEDDKDYLAIALTKLSAAEQRAAQLEAERDEAQRIGDAAAKDRDLWMHTAHQIEAQEAQLREALLSILDTARIGFRGTPYREALDSAQRLLRFACDRCGTLYVNSEVEDHVNRLCKGTHRARAALAATPQLSEPTPDPIDPTVGPELGLGHSGRCIPARKP